MTMVLLWLVGISLFFLWWMYLGYGIAVFLLSRIFGRQHTIDPHLRPKVSLMIMTYNEGKVLRQKLENALQLAYPKDRLEIAVVDSASNDETIAIAESFSGQGIRLLQQGERAGKASAINFGLKNITGEIVVVSDANALMAPDALEKIMPHFADPRVGGVTGAMQQLDIAKTQVSQSGGLYWKIEKFMRQFESQLHSVIAMSGEISAYRRNIFIEDGHPVAWYAKGATDDFEQTLYMIRHGYRVVYEPAAKVWEPAPDNDRDLTSQKVRIITQTIVSVRRNLDLVWSAKAGWYGWFIFSSRKILPLLSPFILLLTWIGTGLLLSVNAFWFWFFVTQTVAYVLYMLSRKLHQPKLMIFPLIHFFLTLNSLVLQAWFEYWRKKDYTVWNKIDSSRIVSS